MKIATVCSGIGSPEVAISQLNEPHEIVFACEIDKYARQSYLANFNPGMMLTDMTKEQWVGPEFYSDVFIGGIPCQAFSLAGKRLGELDPRGLLFFDFYRYVKNQQPKVFIIENVKGLLSDNSGKTFQNWLLLLGNSVNGHHQMFNHPDSLGYNLHHTVLNSKDFGVPQNRERVFIVGIRSDLPNTFRFPKGEPLKIRLKDILEPVVDEKYYLSDSIVEKFIQKETDSQIGFINQDTQASKVFSTDAFSPTVCAGTHGYALGYIIEPEERIGGWRENENTISAFRDDKHRSGIQEEVYHKENGISSTLTTAHIPKIIVKEATKQGYAIAKEGDSINLSNPNSETRRGRVGKAIANTLDTACNQAVVVNEENPVLIEHRGYLNKEPNFIKTGIVPTLRAQSHGHETKVILNQRIRRLTPLECFRLQGFPDEFFHKAKNSGVSDSQLYRQAGNSITTNVMKAILKNILKVIK